MRILVIGGTRFIGPPVVRLLRDQGHEVAVLNRRQHDNDLPPDIAQIRGDRDALHKSKAAIHRFSPDVVLHNVVLNKKQAEGALEVFRGMVDRLVLVSSMDVYRAFARLNGTETGPVEPMPTDEDGPLRERRYPYRCQAKDPSDPRWDYDKIPAEEAVLGDGDLAGTVVRLPMVLGPGDYQHRLYPVLKPMIDGRPAIVLQRGYAHWYSTYAFVENVAAALALACTHPKAAGRIYNIADGALSTLELHGFVAQALDWTGEFVLLPRADLPEELVVPFRVEQSVIGKADRIRKELDYEPPVNLHEAIERTVAWERDHPPDPVPQNLLTYDAQDRVLEKYLGGAGLDP